MSFSRHAVVVVGAWCGLSACQTNAAVTAPATQAPGVASNAVSAIAAPLPASATATPLASTSAPFGHTPHQGPLPEVPAELLGLRDVLKDLGQLELEDPPADLRLSCRGCVKDHPEIVTRFGTPPIAGAFTGPGKKELVLDARGECGVQGHQWGCLLLVGDGPRGRTVLGVLPARSGSTLLHAHRVEGGRDVLVGLFAGFQQGGRWTEAFAVDFAGAEPDDQAIADVFVTEACGENAIGLSTSTGEIDKVVSEDVDRDGLLDLVVTGTHGEIVLKNPIGECRKPKSPQPRRFTLRFLRTNGVWAADRASTALLAGRVRLRGRGVKGLPED